MKAIVISGGGNRGAAAAGKLARLRQSFDLGVGISTGALMLVPALLEEHELLRKVYTNVSPSDIFNINPFDKNGNVNVLNAIWRIMRGKNSLGESMALRLMLADMFKEHNLWDRLQKSGKVAVVGAFNMKTRQVEYFRSDTLGEQDFLDLTWASASFPPMMSVVEKFGSQYVDGGVKDHMGFKIAVEMGATSVTAITMSSRGKTVKPKIKNIFHSAGRIISSIMDEVREADIAFGKQICKDRGIPYALHYVSQGGDINPLLFDKRLMELWYVEAYNEPIEPEIK